MKDDKLELPCADKMSFDSEKTAKDAALVVNWQHGNKLKPYRCNNCSLWHLSSSL